ncbi:MAG: ABC transporter substrate binding protein [Lachnospiraceae bacterium]
MRKKVTICTAFLLSVIIFLLLPIEINADGANEGKRVLFISSYSYTWSTVPLQIKGIQAGLDEAVTLDIEYMNTKTMDDDTSRQMFYEKIKYILGHTKPYDVLIVGDDAAFQFARTYQEELFPKTPIVFLGVNNIESAINAGKDKRITGVVEEFSYKKNIDFAKKVNPGAKKIVAVVDNTVTGKGEQQQFLMQEENYPDLEFSMINASQLTKQQITDKLTQIDQDTILIYLILSEDKEGNVYTNNQAVHLITENVAVPVYRYVQAGIGEGVLGGNIVSHEQSGRIAADMTMQILHGTDPGRIPVQLKSPNEHYFDEHVIKKFGIPGDLIPPGSIVINRDVSFWENYGKVLVITITSSLLTMVILLILLAIYFERKKNILLTEKNRELAEAVQHADQASRAKSQFLSHISHEIRTPMNAIIGITTIAQGHLREPEKLEGYMDKVNASSQLLLSIINDVLDMSSIESNKLVISHLPFDLNALLSVIKTMYSAQYKEKGIDLELCNRTSNSQLMGDELHLKQILLNLVSNAYKFTNSGGKVEIKVEEVSEKDRQVRYRFQVKDTGIGMSEEMQIRAFQAFEQESVYTTQKHGGSGLGLAIAKNLTELMNGTIQVNSKQGVGTCFTLELPFELTGTDNSSELPIPSIQENTDIKEYSDYDFTGYRILLAEDNQLNREIAVELLNMVNLEADCAVNGEEAAAIFEKSEEGTYDLILMDIQMPVLDGYEAARRIRKSSHKQAKSIPIYAMTANAFAEDISVAYSAGMNGHIAKPIDTKLLYSTLSECFKHKGVEK